MSGAKCSACGLELPHAAALRDHLRTSVTCNLTYAGIDLSKSERWQKDLLSKYPPLTIPVARPRPSMQIWKCGRCGTNYPAACPSCPKCGELRAEVHRGSHVGSAGAPDDIDRMIEQRVYEVVRQLTADFDRVLAGAVGRIKKLEKQAETVGLNPQIHRTMRERPDYVNMMSEDEDLLEDGYRGWPVPKDKVIF